MKKFTLIIMMFLSGAIAFPQTILYQDDLESYPVNSYLAVENPAWWDTWSGMPGSGEDLQIKTAFSNSPTKSASIDTDGGPSDALLLLGDKFTGAYELSWRMYVETGKCAYYNIQHFEAPGTEYAMHIFFRTDGSFELTTGGQTFYGTYPKDTWFEVKHNIDLDVNYISLYKTAHSSMTGLSTTRSITPQAPSSSGPSISEPTPLQVPGRFRRRMLTISCTRNFQPDYTPPSRWTLFPFPPGWLLAQPGRSN
jgi:hypothetical protein